METMSELSEQQLSSDQPLAESSTPLSVAEPVSHADLINTDDLSPSISRSGGAVAVSVSSMIDSSEYRSQMPEPTYQTLNGRMSPGYNPNNSYATLTPLQPLPPISTVSEKFGAGSPNVSGSFTLMQNNQLTNSLGMGMTNMDMNPYRYDKISMGMSNLGNLGNLGPSLGSHSPMSMMSNQNGYAAQPQNLGSYSYNQNGLPSPKPEHKMMSPNPAPAYDSYSVSRGLAPPSNNRLHSPNPVMPTTLNGLHHQTHTSSPHSHHPLGQSRTGLNSSTDTQGSKQEVEEINTKELAQKISSELKRYSIPQAVFAQRVLCRSQGTLSDLLRNPKPWSKLKSGRETFRRMWKWLQEPEFQRMSALRLAGGCLAGKYSFLPF